MKKIIIVIVIALAALVGWALLNNGAEVVINSPSPSASLSPSPETTATSTPTSTSTPASSALVVTYTDSGYSPATLKIKKGQTVTWKNNSKFSMWTASAIHPTHKVYPGTDIQLCGQQTVVAMFDACKGVASGESWSFKFDHVGTWKYHNHINSSHSGTIVVE